MWKDLFSIKGRWNRLNRQRYFLYSLVPLAFIIAILIAFALLNTLLSSANTYNEVLTNRDILIRIVNFILYFLGLVSTLFIIWTKVTLGIKRLHDLGHDGIWVIIGFVPYINVLYLIYLLFWKGEKGKNKYGSDPLTQK